jgi:hypothetical protein
MFTNVYDIFKTNNSQRDLLSNNEYLKSEIKICEKEIREHLEDYIILGMSWRNDCACINYPQKKAGSRKIIRASNLCDIYFHITKSGILYYKILPYHGFLRWKKNVLDTTKPRYFDGFFCTKQKLEELGITNNDWYSTMIDHVNPFLKGFDLLRPNNLEIDINNDKLCMAWCF